MWLGQVQRLEERLTKQLLMKSIIKKRWKGKPRTYWLSINLRLGTGSNRQETKNNGGIFA